jgi:hypothetical protein
MRFRKHVQALVLAKRAIQLRLQLNVERLAFTHVALINVTIDEVS